jgi:hypothetical protein
MRRPAEFFAEAMLLPHGLNEALTLHTAPRASGATERSMEIQEVVKAARAKFGAVMKVIRTNEDEYFVACKRDNPPLPERPYMTITAFVLKDSQGVAFYWGHYDMTVEEVYLAITERENRAATTQESEAEELNSAKRPMTNIEKVHHIMTYSKYGALAQLFVMDALHKWADIISRVSPDQVSNGFVDGKAWVGVAREIQHTLRSELVTDDLDPEDETV